MYSNGPVIFGIVDVTTYVVDAIDYMHVPSRL